MKQLYSIFDLFYDNFSVRTCLRELILNPDTENEKLDSVLHSLSFMCRKVLPLMDRFQKDSELFTYLSNLPSDDHRNAIYNSIEAIVTCTKKNSTMFSQENWFIYELWDKWNFIMVMLESGIGTLPTIVADTENSIRMISKIIDKLFEYLWLLIGSSKAEDWKKENARREKAITFFQNKKWLSVYWNQIVIKDPKTKKYQPISLNDIVIFLYLEFGGRTKELETIIDMIRGTINEYFRDNHPDVLFQKGSINNAITFLRQSKMPNKKIFADCLKNLGYEDEYEKNTNIFQKSPNKQKNGV